MKVYLDMCCLKRPFDDAGVPRNRIEAEAVLSIQKAIESGSLEFVRSPRRTTWRTRRTRTPSGGNASIDGSRDTISPPRPLAGSTTGAGSSLPPASVPSMLDTSHGPRSAERTSSSPPTTGC